jgi:hypothetical protein
MAAPLPLKRSREAAPRMTATAKDEIDRFLRTGDHDPYFAAWPGGVVEASRRGTAELKTALIAEVRRHADGIPLPDDFTGIDVVGLARKKLAPMVRGLFPRREQELVLSVLERSVVFLTPASIHDVLGGANWLHTAWNLANLYLASIGADLLASDAPRLVGLSEETTCYVSLEYFRERDRFSNFVVHEAAHIFHNCKRRTVGLPETRTREWLLDIEFRKRETFAYACEAYSRLLELAGRPTRTALLAELADGPMPNDETVDAREYLDILRGAVAARNGWKQILARCAPPRRRSR